MVDRRESLVAGLRDATPLMLGLVPFGLVAGATAVEAGFSPPLAAAMSAIVFAGAAQLAVIGLVDAGAAPAVVVATAVVVNLRYLMYSAGIAPYFRRFSRSWRPLATYLLTDQAFALSVTRFESDAPVAGRTAPVESRQFYYVGAAAGIWAAWQATTIAGVLVGTRVPPAWSLEFAVPLTFLALLVPAVEDRATATAAVVGGGVAVAGVGLPLNLGLIVGAGTGLLTGALAGYLGDRGPGDVDPPSGHGVDPGTNDGGPDPGSSDGDGSTGSMDGSDDPGSGDRARDRRSNDDGGDRP